MVGLPFHDIPVQDETAQEDLLKGKFMNLLYQVKRYFSFMKRTIHSGVIKMHV